jgi:hypothetical protein
LWFQQSPSRIISRKFPVSPLKFTDALAAFELVDNLGAYSIPSETGLSSHLLSSVQNLFSFETTGTFP